MNPMTLRVLELDAEGLSYKEIIKLTGCPSSSIGGILHRYRLSYWEENFPERLKAIHDTYARTRNIRTVSQQLGYPVTFVSKVITGTQYPTGRAVAPKPVRKRCGSCYGITECGASTDCCAHCGKTF